MGVFNTFLVPIDFSAHASKALDYAAALVKTLGGTIHLMHSFHLPTQISALDHTPLYEDLRITMYDNADRKLQEMLHKLNASGIDGWSHVREKPPAEAITETAEKIGADVTVMGTQGAMGADVVRLGSVARRTILTAPCPVITVKETFQVTEPARLRTILVPIDFSEDSSAALGLARSIAKAVGPAHLILVHSHFVPLDFGMLARETHASFVKMISQVAADELEKRLFQLQDEGISAEFVNCAKRPERAIVDIAIEKGTDLIVMGRKGRTCLVQVPLGSVAGRVLRSAPCPVITVENREG
jgi:nucleotide-binding universal stress UspA family protein